MRACPPIQDVGQEGGDADGLAAARLVHLRLIDQLLHRRGRAQLVQLGQGKVHNVRGGAPTLVVLRVRVGLALSRPEELGRGRRAVNKDGAGCGGQAPARSGAP